MASRHHPGEGSGPCQHPPGCGNHEIEGLGYCLHHVPDEDLEEAEEITGMRRCRTRFGEPRACRQYAVEGTDPPRCKNHGANAGSNGRLGAAKNVVQLRVTERIGEILAEHGERLLNAPPVANPLIELQQLAGEVLAFKDIARGVVARLEQYQWRYEGRTGVGEQLRAELLLYGHALDRSERILVNMARLDIASMLARIEAAKIERIERALNRALEASGLDLDAQEAARQVLARELAA